MQTPEKNCCSVKTAPSAKKSFLLRISPYHPLISLVGVSILAGLALNYSSGSGGVMHWMHYFMGFFLCVFALLKIFNLKGFADGFQKYDLLAKRNRNYAFVYPFIELALGLGYFAFFIPVVLYTATMIIMTFGAIGVIKALKSGLKINCPCMGSILNVPLSVVTLTEDLSMAVMAAIMLLTIL